MSNNSVMKENNKDSSYEEKIQEEYEAAVAEGFKGTKEEYLALKDYT